MPNYKITTESDHGRDDSDERIEFPDAKAAADDAQIALTEMARDRMPNGERARFGVEIEDEKGKRIYRASLDFKAEAGEEVERDAKAREQKKRESS